MYQAKKESFKLSETKSLDRASVDFKATINVPDGASTYEIPVGGKWPIIPHPDLLALFDRLKPRLASSFGYTLFQAFVEGKNFNGSKEQKKYAERFTEEMLAKIKVTGISFSGKEKNGIVIKGTYDGSSINTKSLYFTNKEYGEELREIADGIIDEMFAYAYEDKKAQLEIAFKDDKKEDVKDGKMAAANDG